MLAICFTLVVCRYQTICWLDLGGTVDTRQAMDVFFLRGPRDNFIASCQVQAAPGLVEQISPHQSSLDWRHIHCSKRGCCIVVDGFKRPPSAAIAERPQEKNKASKQHPPPFYLCWWWLAQVYISGVDVDVGTAYIGVPLKRRVSMVNLSNLEVSGSSCGIGNGNRTTRHQQH